MRYIARAEPTCTSTSTNAALPNEAFTAVPPANPARLIATNAEPDGHQRAGGDGHDQRADPSGGSGVRRSLLDVAGVGRGHR